MKSFKMFLLGSALLILGLPVCVWGAPAGAKATGANLPKYQKVVVRKVDVSTENSFSTSMKNYLEEAAKKADQNTQYKIVIPPGTYKARYWQTVPSNTWIYAKGATIRAIKGKKRMVLLSNQGDSAGENIKIEGGVWDTTTQNKSDSPVTAPFRFAHVKNLVFENVTIKANRYAHLIEVSDIQGLTIRNCSLSGNDYEYQLQPKEAIQLDVATKEAMPNMTPYNGKGCHNAVIENNRFNRVARGVGSHNSEVGAEKDPYTNVIVRNNVFKNLKGEAVFIKWWKYCTVDKNTVENGKHAGIYIQSGWKLKVTNNAVKKISSFSGARRKEYGADRAGVFLQKGTDNQFWHNKISGFKGKTVSIKSSKTCKRNSIKK